jgi:POT family proton-dependent oligopeptide transporter
MAVEGHQSYLEGDKVIRDSSALQVFYFSLALIVVGVGFLKPNISTIVGKLYSEGDPRRDSGFTIFYMGINLGSFIATLLCGYLGETYGWSYGFGAAGIGMLLGLVVFLWGQRYLEGHAEPANPALLKEKSPLGLSKENTIYTLAVLSLAAIWQMLQYHAVVSATLNTMAIAVLAGLAWFLVAKCNAEERGKMGVLITLTISTVVFWALFEQSAASMTLYADRVLDRNLFGFELTASQFGSMNAFFIFTTAPFFAWLWIFLAKRGLEPSTPVKFGLGIIQAGLGFAALVYGAQHPDEMSKVAAYWLVLAYFLHTTGELCLSPVGLSAVTKLAVPSVVGVMMGSWFLATAYSEMVAAQIAKIASIHTVSGAVTDVSAALASYTELFEKLTYVGVGFGLLLVVASPLLKKHMHGVK